MNHQKEPSVQPNEIENPLPMRNVGEGLVPGICPESQIEEAHENDQLNRPRTTFSRIAYAIYILSLVLSIALWLPALRSPLWLDETGSFWQISAGFSAIWTRILHVPLPPSPVYIYTLWLSTKIFGNSELVLRIPSIIAMLGAVYLLFRAAREMFDLEFAILTVIIFCFNPIVVYASIDVRPYAFAVLATNATIFILVRLRRDNSNRMAALLGLSAATAIWCHFLFIVLLPPIILCFFIVKRFHHKTFWRQFGVALVVFALAFLPVIPGMLSLFRTSHTHVFEPAPDLMTLFIVLLPALPLLSFICAGLIYTLAPWRRDSPIRFQGWRAVFCLFLALIPVLILYGVSAGTSIHLFVLRHELCAVPGIALCWALLIRDFRIRAVRLLFCVTLSVLAVYIYCISPSSAQHGYYTWKYALDAAEKNASADNAPVLICSDFPEADYVEMPLDSAKESRYFAPLSYYKLSVPVVPLPRALNDEAIRVGSQFLHQAAMKHERFLALAFQPSYKTLDWLAQNAAATHSVRKLGEFDKIKILEFTPRAEADALR